MKDFEANKIKDLSKGYISIFGSLTRVGFYPFLFWFYIIFVAIAILDISYYGLMGLDLGSACKTFRTFQLNDYLLPVGELFILFFISLPLLIGIFKFYFELIPSPNKLIGFRYRSGFIFFLNLFCATFLAIFYLFAKSMEINSGYSLSFDAANNNFSIEFLNHPWVAGSSKFEVLELDRSFEFTSIFARTIELIVFFFLNYHWQLLLLIVPWIVDQSDNFLSKTWLTDLDRNCYPVQNRKFLNFNSADTAPVIKFVKEERDTWLEKYDKLPQRTLETENYLMDCWRICQNQILELLGHNPELHKKHIRLFNETGRALESTLDSYPNPKVIIASPYETKTLIKVCKCYQRDNSCEFKYLNPAPHFFEQPKQKQINRVVEDIVKHLEPLKTNIVLLSEVCYATGIQTEIEDIISKVKKSIESSHYKDITPPKYIIVGSYAIENLIEPKGVKLGDAYIFNGDKWLMAPEPCGIVIHNQLNYKLKPYDCLDDKISITNFDPTKVAGLKSCLDLLNKFDNIDRKVFTHRSHEMRDIFLADVKDYFDVIGQDTGLKFSKMISLKPKKNYQWNYKKSYKLESYLKENKILAKVIKIKGTVPWIRLSFSFFHTNNEIEELGKTLKKALIPIHSTPKLFFKEKLYKVFEDYKNNISQILLNFKFQATNLITKLTPQPANQWPNVFSFFSNFFELIFLVTILIETFCFFWIVLGSVFPTFRDSCFIFISKSLSINLLSGDNTHLLLRYMILVIVGGVIALFLVNWVRNLLRPTSIAANSVITSNCQPYEELKLTPIKILTKNQFSIFSIWTWLSQPRKWKVAEDWNYEVSIDGNKKTIRINKGFVFDGASVPRFFWWLFNPSGILLIPGLIHDFAYRYAQLAEENSKPFKITQKTSDKLFYKLSVQINGFTVINSITYLAVRCARFAWNANRKENKELDENGREL